MITNPEPLVSIITINWNGFPDTILCVQSLLEQTYTNYNIYIVDNNSDNQEGEKLIKFFDREQRVKIILHPENSGYAGGNNVGFKNSDPNSQFFWCINNDTIVRENTLSLLIAYALQKSKPCLIGSTILYPDAKTIYALGGGQFNSWTGVDQLVGARQDYSTTKPKPALAYISGAALLIPKEIYEQIGGFDEDYFLYSEEADFAHRAVQKGFGLGYEPKAVLLHQSAKSSIFWSTTYVYYFLRGKVIYLKKNIPFWKYPTWVCTLLVYYGFGFSIIGLLRMRRNYIPLVMQALEDGFRKKWGRKKF
jgi:GT2 family glycosyltransferase